MVAWDGGLPLDRGQGFRRVAQHLGRTIDPGDRRPRPTLGEHPGDVTGPAAKVDDLRRRLGRDLVHQVNGRPQAVAGEFQILRRVPAHYSLSINIWRLTKPKRIRSMSKSEANRPRPVRAVPWKRLRFT